MKKGHFEHHEQLDFIGCMERLIDYAVDGIQDNSGREKTQLYKLGNDLKSLMRQPKNNDSDLKPSNEDAWLIDKANYFIQQLYQFVPEEIQYETEKTQNLKKEIKKLKKLTNLLQQEKKQKKMKKSKPLLTKTEEEFDLLADIQNKYKQLKRKDQYFGRQEFFKALLIDEAGPNADLSWANDKYPSFFTQNDLDEEQVRKAEDRASGSKPSHDDILLNANTGEIRIKGFPHKEKLSKKEQADFNKAGNFLSLEYNVILDQLASAYEQAFKFYEEGNLSLKEIVNSNHDFEDKDKNWEKHTSKHYHYEKAIESFKKCTETMELFGLAGNNINEGSKVEVELYNKAMRRISHLEANLPKKNNESWWSRMNRRATGKQSK